MKKSTKFLNLFLIIVIAAGLLFIVIKLASIVTTQNQSATDAQASGFGSNATKDLFAPAAELFSNSLCENIFNAETLQSDKLPLIKAENLTLDSVNNVDAEDYKPLICEYKFEDGKSITFTIHSYTADSSIDETQADLFDRVNGETFTDIIDTDTMGIMSYFYGTDITDQTICRTNIFHPINDFEYADILYRGFDCSTIFNLNREITGVFNKYMFNAMEFVYANFEGKTTADLLDEWGFSGLKTNLNFYE